MASNNYRRYNKNVPEWLVNRPKKIVSHIIERITQSKDIESTSITCASIKRGSMNKFYVNVKDKDYLVIINDENDDDAMQNIRSNIKDEGNFSLSCNLHKQNNKIPYCSCYDWKKFQLPCKHMLAIMSKHSLTWDSFPVFYRDSPYFKVCNDWFNVKNQNEQDNDDIIQDNDTPIGEAVVYTELPKMKFPKRTFASNIRETLKEIKSVTYMIRNEDELQPYDEQLQIILNEMRLMVPSDDGLLLENNCKNKIKNSTSKKERNFSMQEKNFKTYMNLPKPKKRKSKFSGRVGRKNEAARAATILQVNNDKANGTGNLVEEAVIEEQVLIDNCEYDIPLYPSIDDELSLIPDEQNADQNDNQEQEIKLSLEEKNRQLSPDHELIKTNIIDEALHANEDNEILITKVVENNGSSPRKKRKLHLSSREEKIIINNKMLTDESIDIGQQILQQQFPLIGGFADIALSEENGFDVVKRQKPFIQLLHTGHTHWICVANMAENRNNNNNCQVYDSNNQQGEVSTNSLDKICKMLYCKKSQVTLTIKPVQKQLNSIDCGIFALAFATALAYGDDPSKLNFNQKLMRKHLVNFLKSNYMVRFPLVPKNVAKCEEFKRKVNIYCHCRVPYYPVMIECEKCNIWYHQLCENVSDENINQEEFVFICKSCSKVV